MIVDNVKARLATIEDLDFVCGDGSISREVVARKINLKECFLVEFNSQPVGYLRLEYLWSLVPYIALIHIQKGYQKQLSLIHISEPTRPY